MSGSEDQGGAGRREVAYRLFAAEFDDADFSYSESDEERAPNYVVTPTGGRVNRLFVVGVLTEVENASEDVLRARIVDPTGAFVVYAGQYQPEAQAFFERARPPMFVAVTGKARTFQPDDAETTYTSVRPENVNEVDAETRDRWTVGTARQTLTRVRTMARALTMDERGDELRAALETAGVDTGLAAGIPLAVERYGTTPAYLDAVRHTAVQAAEVVAGEREEVDAHTASPDAPGDADSAALATLDIAANVGGESGEPAPATDVTESTTSPSATAATETTDSDSDSDDSPGTVGAEPTSGDTEGGAEAPSSTDSAAEPAGSAVETEPTTGTEQTTESTEPVTEPGQSGTDPVETTTDPVETTAGPGTGDATADPAETETEPSAGTAGDGLDDFDPGEFELDEDEREEIESEYGTEFQSGSEVADPGEAGIDTPDPEGPAEAEGEADSSTTGTAGAEPAVDPEPTTDGDSPPGVEPVTETESLADAEPAAEEVDVETAVMDAMEAHDDGGGAGAEDIVAAVTDRVGADESAVRDAIQDALMDGRCYEPDDDVYKPI